MTVWASVSGAGALLGFYNDTLQKPPSGAIELTAAQYQQWLSAQSGLRWNGTALVAYTPPAPASTPAQQAATALAAGLAVTSTSTPALNATYGTSAAWQQNMISAQLEAQAIASGLLPGTTLAYPDIGNTMHTFTPAQFTALAAAVRAYVLALNAVTTGQTETLPVAVAVIA